MISIDRPKGDIASMGKGEPPKRGEKTEPPSPGKSTTAKFSQKEKITPITCWGGKAGPLQFESLQQEAKWEKNPKTYKVAL